MAPRRSTIELHPHSLSLPVWRDSNPHALVGRRFSAGCVCRFHHRVATGACYLTGASHGSRTRHLVRTKDACSHAYSASIVSSCVSPTGTRTHRPSGRLASALPRRVYPARSPAFKPGAYAFPPPGKRPGSHRLLRQKDGSRRLDSNQRIRRLQLRPLSLLGTSTSGPATHSVVAGVVVALVVVGHAPFLAVARHRG